MVEQLPLFAEVAERQKTLIEQLSPIDQIRVIVGLFVVIVLGVVIFMVIKAGSHMVKGFAAAANRLPSVSQPDEDDWARKPLNEGPSDE